MKNNKNKSIKLSDLHGVLPPMNSDDIIILLCIKEDIDENTLLIHLDYFFKNFEKIHIHIHIIGNKLSLKEKLIIFSNSKYNITVTEELFEYKNFSFTEDIFNKISIIRLNHFINLLNVPIVFTTSLNLLLDLNFLRAKVNESPVLIDKQYSQRLIIDGKKKSISIIGSIAKIFLKDITYYKKDKNHQAEYIISLVINKAIEKKPDLVQFIDTVKNKEIEISDSKKKDKCLSCFWPIKSELKILLQD